jgi:hypothetical protein
MCAKIFFIISFIFCSSLYAQNSSLIIGSETMEPFLLTINGRLINSTPQNQVRVDNLPLGLQKALIQIPQRNGEYLNIRTNVLLSEAGEHYYNLKRNSRSEYVLRLYNLIPFPINPNLNPVNNIPIPNVPQGNNPIVISPQININVGGNQNTVPQGNPISQGNNPLPGYTGRIGCPYPVSDATFQQIKNTIQSRDFESDKLTIAKQVISTNCLLSKDVKEIMSLFNFESSRLEFAKFAYGYTYDLGNYFIVNDAFNFESSISELDRYIQTGR